MPGEAEQKSRAQKITEARPPQVAELTVAKFGSNFFVNLDTSGKTERLDGDTLIMIHFS